MDTRNKCDVGVLFIEIDLNHTVTLPFASFNKLSFYMPAKQTAKIKRTNDTDDLREECIQAAMRDVEQHKVPKRAAARLHKV